MDCSMRNTSAVLVESVHGICMQFEFEASQWLISSRRGLPVRRCSACHGVVCSVAAGRVRSPTMPLAHSSS